MWLLFGISNTKIISEHGQKYSNSAQAKICCISEQNIEENYQLWDIINVLALGIIQKSPNMHVKHNLLTL